jgi:hypothetical protein
MKKLYFFIILIGLLVPSCKDKSTETPLNTKGKLLLSSNPTGAAIYFMGTNTGNVTPMYMGDYDEGVYDITFKLTDYFDTSFTATIKSNLTTTEDIDMQIMVAPSCFYTKSGDYLILYARFNYDVVVTAIKETKPNNETVNFVRNVSITKNAYGYEIARYYMPNGNINGIWKFNFTGYLQSNSTHVFNKDFQMSVN